jgi:hypothetical protein
MTIANNVSLNATIHTWASVSCKLSKFNDSDGEVGLGGFKSTLFLDDIRTMLCSLTGPVEKR